LKLTFSAAVILCSSSAAYPEGVPGELNFVVKKNAFAVEPFAFDPLAAQQKCPGSNAEWETWRDAAIKALLQKSPTDQTLVSLKNTISKSAEFDVFINTCRKSAEFKQADRAEEIIGNLGRFSHALSPMNKTDHQFGFTITDDEFIAQSEKQMALPDLLKSQEFLKAVSREDGLKEAKELIENHNSTLPEDRKWKVALYKSQFLPTPDCFNTFGRFFVYVPDHDGFAKWIQYGIRTPDYVAPPVSAACPVVPDKSNNFSVVSIAPASGGKSITFSLDYWRTYEQDGTITVKTRYESVQNTENCFLCHKTAPLGIHPEVEYELDASGRLTERAAGSPSIFDELNTFIGDPYGQVSFGAWMNPQDFGPSLGPLNIQRDAAYVRACARNVNLNDTSLKKVARAMRCSGCHEEGNLGPLNFPQPLRSDAQSAQKQVRGYILNGLMPPENTLTSEERSALYNCVVTEYYNASSETGILVDWLKSKQ
jgi:hypothetical protein